MSNAAGNGHLEVAQLLSGHIRRTRQSHDSRLRDAECALGSAALDGRLKVVVWLHHEYTDMRAAALQAAKTAAKVAATWRP
jgi:hypothetical protein